MNEKTLRDLIAGSVPDQRYVASRFLSIFSWGRPPVPWDIADWINYEVSKHEIKSIGVTGSLSPSVITSSGFDNPIEINAFAKSYALWKEGIDWKYVIEDSPGMEKTVPWPNPYLPVDFDLWDGATPFFDSEAIFTDLPFSHHLVDLNMGFLDEGPYAETGRPYKLILMGFLEGHEGPGDILNWAQSRGYVTTEHRAPITNWETVQELVYRLVVASLV
jgi:hypothetical protein